MQTYGPSESNIPRERRIRTRILGTGAATPTKEIGNGVTVSRVAAGRYLYTFNENPGTFINIEGFMFGAATPGDVKGQTVTHDTYDTTNGVFSIELSVWSSTFSADDLQATETLSVTFVFAGTSAVG